MEGSNHRVCNSGEWDGEKPVCFGLNQENAYACKNKNIINYIYFVEIIFNNKSVIIYNNRSYIYVLLSVHVYEHG